MAHHLLTPEHVCKRDSQAVCWHVRGTVDGQPVAFYAISDTSNGPVVSVRMEHPDAEIASVVFGRFDEQHATQRT